MRLRRALRRRIPTTGAVDDLAWMTAISSLTDGEVDELLAGRVPDGHGELAPLADVTMAVRERTTSEPAPIMRYPLRHALVRSGVALEPRRGRRLMHAAIGGAAITVLGLAGAANALPAPMQAAVAEVGDLVGVAVPHTGGEDPPELPEGVANPARSAVSEDEGTGASGIGDAPPDVTPGGATPADPGTAGDLEPATPAVPPPTPVEGDEHGQAPSPGGKSGPDANEGSSTADSAPDPPVTDDEGGDEDQDSDDGEHARETIQGRVDRRVTPSTGRPG